jgi:hypothetical protein
MFEMIPEHDPAAPESVMVWHAVRPGGEVVALCGRALPPGRPAAAKAADAATDRYCEPCLNAVSWAMAQHTVP